MSFGFRESMAAVAAVFLVFLLAKLRPSSRRTRALAEEEKAARARVAAATTPRAKAEALCDAARAAAEAHRWSASAGLFLRAMNADAAWPGAIAQASMALAQKKPRMLEKVLWRRLERLPWDGAHGDAVRAGVVALAGLYDGALRDRARATVLRRLVDKGGAPSLP